jgi:hypothetical protein
MLCVRRKRGGIILEKEEEREMVAGEDRDISTYSTCSVPTGGGLPVGTTGVTDQRPHSL